MRTVLLGILLSAAWAGSPAQAPLLICLPGGNPPSRIDSTLSPSMSPRKIIAFLRVRDLEDVLPTYPTAPILTTSSYAEQLQGYTVLLKGRKRGALGKYLVVSEDSSVGSAGLSALRVGILDFLGREKIPRFVEDAFGAKPAVIKRVNKREDLLSLLGMEAVDAVIVEAGDLPELRKETRLRLFAIMESKPMDHFPVLILPAGGDEGVKQVLLKQPKPVLEILGVERWE